MTLAEQNERDDHCFAFEQYELAVSYNRTTVDSVAVRSLAIASATPRTPVGNSVNA